MTKAQLLEKFIDNLSLPNFQGAEFTPYWSKVRNGQKNLVPPDSLWLNVVPTLVVIQRLRTELGVPISINSSYRSPAYNMAIGGAAASFHIKFMAIDFHCKSGTAQDWGQKLKSYRGDQFDLPGVHGSFAFYGGIGIYPTQNFVHLDTRGSDADWLE
jgi:N-acetylmuramoyl-L-alanine amidase